MTDPRRTTQAGVYVVGQGGRRLTQVGVYVVHGENQRQVTQAGIYAVAPEAAEPPPPEPPGTPIITAEITGPQQITVTHTTPGTGAGDHALYMSTDPADLALPIDAGFLLADELGSEPDPIAVNDVPTGEARYFRSIASNADGTTASAIVFVFVPLPALQVAYVTMNEVGLVMSQTNDLEVQYQSAEDADVDFTAPFDDAVLTGEFRWQHEVGGREPNTTSRHRARTRADAESAWSDWTPVVLATTRSEPLPAPMGRIRWPPEGTVLRGEVTLQWDLRWSKLSAWRATQIAVSDDGVTYTSLAEEIDLDAGDFGDRLVDTTQLPDGLVTFRLRARNLLADTVGESFSTYLVDNAGAYADVSAPMPLAEWEAATVLGGGVYGFGQSGGGDWDGTGFPAPWFMRPWIRDGDVTFFFPTASRASTQGFSAYVAGAAWACGCTRPWWVNTEVTPLTLGVDLYDTAGNVRYRIGITWFISWPIYPCAWEPNMTGGAILDWGTGAKAVPVRAGNLTSVMVRESTTNANKVQCRVTAETVSISAEFEPDPEVPDLWLVTIRMVDRTGVRHTAETEIELPDLGDCPTVGVRMKSPSPTNGYVMPYAVALANTGAAGVCDTPGDEPLVEDLTGLPGPGLPGLSEALEKAWAFVFDGHVFYVLNRFDAPAFVCDLTTGQWHEWYTGLPNATMEQLYWNMFRGIMWKGRVIACDFDLPRIWELDPPAMLDEEEILIQRAVTAFQPLRGSGSVRQGSLRLTARKESLGQAATITMRFSDDGGKTWSRDFTLTLPPNSYSKRIEWRSLGRIRAPGRIWEIEDAGGLVRIEGCDTDIGGA